MIGEGVILAGAVCGVVGVVIGLSVGIPIGIAWHARGARCSRCLKAVATMCVSKYHHGTGGEWCPGSGEQIP